MFKKKLHLHSMLVHVIAVLAPLTAVAYVLLAQDIAVGGFDAETWKVLVAAGIVVMLVTAVPSIATGVFERGHKYAKWHSTHKYKLAYSLVLLAALVAETALLVRDGLEVTSVQSPMGFLLVVVNNVAGFFLSFYGLKISLGQQSLSGTSYEPDLFKKEPFDILTRAGKYAKEEPVYVDLYEENR